MPLIQPQMQKHFLADFAKSKKNGKNDSVCIAFSCIRSKYIFVHADKTFFFKFVEGNACNEQDLTLDKNQRVITKDFFVCMEKTTVNIIEMEPCYGDCINNEL